MIASASSRSLAIAFVLAAVTALPLGCFSKHAQDPGNDFLMPLARRAPAHPSEVDYSARNLIRGALLDHDDVVAEELAELQEIAESDSDESEKAKRRLALSTDLANTTVDHPDEYRERCKKLKRQWDLNPRLKERLDECVKDDLLKIANRRVWDVRESIWADTYNAVAEPLSRSVLSGGSLTPLYLATSVANYLALMNERDPFPVQYRQALTHRKNFLEQNPDSPEAPKVKRQVEKAQRRFDKVESRSMSHEADKALRIGKVRYAVDLSARARLRNPDNKRAARVHAEAIEALKRDRELRIRSQSPIDSPEPFSSPVQEQFAVTLLNPESDLRREARKLLADPPNPELEDTARYVMAMDQSEKGQETASWRTLQRIAAEGPENSTTARHAWALLGDSTQNPYGSFVQTRNHQNTEALRWHLFSGFYSGPRYRRLWRPAAWLLDLPAAAQTLATSPVRWLVGMTGGGGGEKPNFKRATAASGYRYLARRPEGEHLHEIADWLYDYESKNKNWNAALRLADLLPDTEPEERVELVEKAAEQQIAAAANVSMRDQRSSMLRNTAQEFPDSLGGHVAGVQVREMVLGASEQKIRMTRSFLQENPKIAGPLALGIRPDLLDEREDNGELHPQGVTFLGGRTMKFAFLNPSGKENDPPIEKKRKISQERLARVVAELDGATRHNMRVDDGDIVQPDPRRDHFFERARLGVAEQPDRRAAAQSNYVYRSMRERYGMVRGRDSVLPFDIVVTGSLTDMGIAAFPRWRKPRETPDSFLYK